MIIHSKKRILCIIPFIVWVAVIMKFSNQSFEEQSIQPRLKEFISEESLRKFVPDISFTYGEILLEAKEDPFHFIEFIFRKTAHVVTYGLLAAFAYLALIPYQLRLRWQIVLCLMSVVTVASWDEWNQSQLSTRTGMLKDVYLDFFGGCLGVGTAVWIHRIIKRRSGTRYESLV